MNIEEAYSRAKFNLVGKKIIVGPHGWSEEWLPSIGDYEYSKLPFCRCWSEYLFMKRLGFVPSFFAQLFSHIAGSLGHEVTDDEWVWLDKESCSKEDANAWLKSIHDEFMKRDEREWA